MQLVDNISPYIKVTGNQAPTDPHLTGFLKDSFIHSTNIYWGSTTYQALFKQSGWNIKQKRQKSPSLWKLHSIFWKLIPGSGRSPREGIDYPLQYSYLEKSMDREAWGATDHVVAKRKWDWTERLTLSLSLLLPKGTDSHLPQHPGEKTATPFTTDRPRRENWSSLL